MTKINMTKSFIILVCLLGGTIMKAQFTQIAKVVSENRESRAEYGTSVAIAKDFAIVGASRETIASGAAYVYSKDDRGVWSYSQRLAAFDPNQGAEFGGGVKFSDDYLVVAAGRANVENIERAGALYVYDYQNDNWEYSTKLVASDYSGDAKLGMNPTSMDVDGNTIVAGAPAENGWIGSVYVFTKEGGTWTETQKILSPEAPTNDTFGVGVSISGDYLVIGASDVDRRKGATYIYMKNSSGIWEYNQTLMASDASNGSFFGNSVNISGDQLVVGAYGTNSEQGAAYVYEKDNEGVWLEVQKLNGNSSIENAQFGWSTDIQPNYISVSAPHIFGLEVGEAYFYKRESNGLWVEDQIILGEDTIGEDFYGWSIAMHEKQLIASAPWEDHDANGENGIDRAGSAYIFEDSEMLGGSTDNSLEVIFTVYPVPAKDHITIATNSGTISKIKLMNLQGRLIKEETLSVEREYNLDVSRIAQGIYFVNVYMQDGRMSTKKIIKIN
ncbi:secreted adhesin with an integrin alpha (FG-GAP repeat) and Por secretion system C-terminal sorting domains [Psychroflexus torquis ATCC 700755]|uniref:Secreted adhesin with an integrin alpha (FG-GAP repeat) and Por secretion system C-terminal sorting domains n=1 Tax=Psychroflexus torquis (strain ATCC 700755 / CIP 106069 / ACAM 623) TaxID=313595 RepID=K4INH2_PSYTT|nr:T9SS type A sorting domain-containing protein [Psychroflexus torquis]AFU70566.1 secreted adhesin with an integrin alpha (FG-GAP repeat) and Por secretion system C-terminal sorting domains [Psychroflexus torquis ATCC 700755]